ncbi:hypothetical protein [uncultured Maribacter sp.]|uniref:hypothetical protein n=1 Tax=uncultured Maribacter sp. TaxID=431308 RepID=UPI00260F466A|nr:hypothetical protein [uncultured Maribacter sp.]
MANKKRHWLWNLILLITLTVCLLAFIVHYKNWTKIEPNSIKMVSGVYYKEIKFVDVDSVSMVQRIPAMERLNGFSALSKGNGLYREFKDSLTDKKVYVFVDNFEQQKIRLVYQDSLKLFFNYKDSVETKELFSLFESKLNALKKQN